MNNKKMVAIGVLFLLLLLASGYFAAEKVGKKLDILDSRMSSLEASNKILIATCTAPAPVCELPPVEKAAPKKLLRDDIYKIIFDHKKELNVCYQLRTHKKEDLRRLIVSLVIKNDGTVLEVKTLNSDIKNKKIDECIISLIKGMQFPEFDGEELYKDEIYISFDSRSLI